MSVTYIKKVNNKYINNIVIKLAKDSFCREWHDYIKIVPLKTQDFSWVTIEFSNKSNDIELAEDFIYCNGANKIRKILKEF